MGVYTHTEGNWLSRRGGFLVLLVLFHALLLWGFKSGFAVKIIKSITEPIKAEIIEVKPPEEPPPPPPPVKAVEMPPVSVPPVLVNIQIPIETPPIQITTAPPPPGPPAPPVFGPPAPPAPPAPTGVMTARTISYAPSPADFYPPSSISLQEEGKVKVRLCYGTNGRVETSELSETSGKPKLDAAAVKLGKQYRFKPGTLDKVPQADCVVLPVSFSLKDLQ
jgi:periplasmic protein TonB